MKIHPSKAHNPGAYTHPERPMDEMCPFCKNEDTRIIVSIERIPVAKYYGHEDFVAVECSACGGKFHFTRKKFKEIA